MAWLESGTQFWDTGTSKTPGIPGAWGSPVPQDPVKPSGPQELWTLGPLGISGFQDPQEITSTEIQNVNTVQFFLICCKQYYD